MCGQCLKHPPAWQAALAAVDYAKPWDELIARFKYQAEPALARHLANIMLAEPLIREACFNADAVLPIPLSRERLAQRGYNQALELSKALVKGSSALGKRLPHSSRPHLPPQLLPHTLLRLRDTREQKLLSQSQRALNVKGAFGLNPFATAPLPARVLLVDDVMTSGASLKEATNVLLANGAQSVNLMVFARTPLH
jgi:ComF family protein